MGEAGSTHSSAGFGQFRSQKTYRNRLHLREERPDGSHRGHYMNGVSVSVRRKQLSEYDALNMTTGLKLFLYTLVTSAYDGGGPMYTRENW
jgi:hypothetical protein